MEKTEKCIITPDSRISTLISLKGESVVEALASLNPHFSKLRNPLLRKLFASRVSIRDACRIANCHLSQFMHTLKGLGFLLATEDDLLRKPSLEGKLDQPEYSFEEFDVRGILSRGEDPLKPILHRLQSLKEGIGLKLINSFEPLPLIHLLHKKGYKHQIEFKGQEEVITYFYKESEGGIGTNYEMQTVDTKEAVFADLLKRYENKLEEIDVRNMEMPQPMLSILNALDLLPPYWALYVHHKKLPVYLIPHLEDKGFSFVYSEVDNENLLLIIYPSKG